MHNRNLPGRRIPHHNEAMRTPAKTTGAALLCGIALYAGAAALVSAQSAPRQAGGGSHGRRAHRTLTSDEGLTVVSAALRSKVRRYAGHDCSHLVHAIYERAGFPYAYADSDDLYDGVESFRRVKHAQPGDLVVWRGHAGIVLRPSRHVFFSFMSKGPGPDDYESRYWRGRGHPRFYRYLRTTPVATAIRSSGRAEPFVSHSSAKN
jgi:cell wall-associated NlpC family hydrolase